MVVSNCVTVTQKSPLLLRSLLFRFSNFSRTTTCNFNCQNMINPIHISRGFTSCRRSFNLHSTNGFKVSGGSELGFRFSGHRSFRVSSGGGSGGGAGRFGGPGGGRGGQGGGGSDWSLLSWYLSLLARYPVMTKAVTFALLTLVGDLICQVVIDQVPSLDLKRTSIFHTVGAGFGWSNIAFLIMASIIFAYNFHV